MAAFDFPSSPTVGQVYSANGVVFQWNGQAWVGGQPSTVPTEQFIDLSGLTTGDIQVPSWARGARIDGSVICPGTLAGLRLSADGTTFFAGASDYQNVGPVHSSGSGGFNVASLTGNTMMFLTMTADSATLPQLFSYEIGLTRPTTSIFFPGMTYAKVFDSAAASQYRTNWMQSTMMPGVTTALAIKALRFVTFTGAAFGAGSWARVRWFGDPAQVPMTNAVALRDYWAAGPYTPGTTVLGLGDDRKLFALAMGAAAVFTLPTGMPAGWSVLVQANGNPTAVQTNYAEGGASQILFNGKAQLLTAANRMVFAGRGEIIRFTWSAGGVWVAQCVQSPFKGMTFTVGGTGSAYLNTPLAPTIMAGGGTPGSNEAAASNAGMRTPFSGLYLIHFRMYWNANAPGGGTAGQCFLALGDGAGYDGRFEQRYVWTGTGGETVSQSFVTYLEQNEVNQIWAWASVVTLLYLPSNTYYFAQLVSR